ncbi:DUF2470 domain-containing protein [Streptomyces sp. NPDC001743]|uniref:DUF2470 domain-containing protein n=1 Tax=Streptomyces sp. NPDC001743 TaxID=3154397 RepID=UPI003326796E
MRPFSARGSQPAPAERMRSILTAAHSMTVVSDDLGPVEVHRLDGTGGMGHVHLHEPSGTGPAAPVPVRLEFTDVAPTPVRDRLRARVTMTGLLAAPYDPQATGSICMEFGQAVLDDGGARTFVPLSALQTARPDPLAPHEADMLTHLMDSHAELVPLLLRLVRPAPDRTLLRALPVALDRYGVTLRLEYARTRRDVRLPFATPLTEMSQAAPRIHALLTAARRASHPSRLFV